MNQLVLIVFVLSVFVVCVWIAYFTNPFFIKKLIGEHDPFERKIFHGNLPFWQLILLAIVFPILCLFFVVLWYKINELSQVLDLGANEKSILWGLFTMFVLASYGTGAHAASVSISHYMGELTITKAFKVTEFYHHLVSHFLIIMSVIGIGILLSLHQIDHPLLMQINFFEMFVCVISGVASGWVLGLLIIEGRGIYYSFPALVLGVVVLLYITLDGELDVFQLPITMYVLFIYVGALLMMLIRRMRTGSLAESLGEFFHNPMLPQS